MSSSLVNRRSLPVTAALLLLAAPVFAAEPAAPAAPAAQPDAEGVQREALERQLEAAQGRLDAAVREVEQLSSRLGAHVGERFMRMRMQPPPRAMLGLQISTAEGTGGAKVLAVSPGGPAEAAGIKADDVLVSIAGKDLTKVEDPGRALVEAMRAQEPDQKVKVRVKRDGKTRDVEVAARAAPRFPGYQGRADGPPGPRFLAPGRPGGLGPLPGPGQFNRRHPDGPPTEGELAGRGGMPFAGMELATLSEKLGGYFGAKDGVLVVRAGGNDALKLQDGDVILKIDGREPNSASHATRILRSYQRGEKLQMIILRAHKTQTLDVTLPGG